MYKFRSLQIILTALIILALSVGSVAAQGPGQDSTASSLGSAFTYQGQLKDGSGNPVSEICNFKFSLWDGLTSVNQIGSNVNAPGVVVSQGLFTVKLDFGAGAFNGNARWLESAVQCGSDSGFTTLSPRQELTPAPYALYAASAGNAATAGNANTVTNGVYTTGSYSNPSWLTSLDGGKITGAVGNATNATTVTNGVYTTGTYNDPAWITHLAGSKITGEVDNADTVDGQHASAFQKHYANEVVVAKSGGDFTTIPAALNSITNASASNPYLIHVAPGIYDESINMKSYVDIEGAGEDATTITYVGSNPSTGSVTGTVNIADHTELRFLTVENTGGNFNAIPIYAACTGLARLTHVTLSASGGSNYDSGLYSETGCALTLTDVNAKSLGVSSSTNLCIRMGEDASLTNVTATASGGDYADGIYVAAGSVNLTNVVASATGATYNNTGIYVDGIPGDTSSNLMDVSASASGGGLSEYAIYIYHISPKMTGVVANAWTTVSPTIVIGIYNSSASPTMTDVIVSATGGQKNYGIENSSANPLMTNVTATATGVSGSTESFGMWNNASSPTILNSLISGSGVGNTDGIVNNASSGTYTVKINNSQIYGTNSTIYTGVSGTGTYTIYIGASQISGGGVWPRPYTAYFSYVCTGAYNDSYVSLGTNCQ